MVEMEIGVIYSDGYMHFTTPDGIGRIWGYGDAGLAELMEDFGIEEADVIYVPTVELADY